MEGQRPVSGLSKILTGVLIAFLGALSYDSYKEKFVLGNVGGEPGRGRASGMDIIEPKLENTVVLVPSKPTPEPPPPVPAVNRVVVPNLVGMDVETAFRTLEGLGLQVQRRDGADRSAAGWVETQWPPSQQLADAGAIVSLGVRLPEEVVEQPVVQTTPPPVQEVPRFRTPTVVTPGSGSYSYRPPLVLPNPYRRPGTFVPPPYDSARGRTRNPQHQPQYQPRYQPRTPVPPSYYRPRTFVPPPIYQNRTRVPNPGYQNRTFVPRPYSPNRMNVPNPRSPYRPGVPGFQRQSRPPDRWRSSPYRRGPGWAGDRGRRDVLPRVVGPPRHLDRATGNRSPGVWVTIS
jgi:hypothetical protein